MGKLARNKLIERGMNVSREDLIDQNAIWARYSSDKIDIGIRLARVLRTLEKTLPLNRALRALSLGSGTEPEFRILEAFFSGGLYLLDIDQLELQVIRERLRHQEIKHVKTIRGDINRIFIDPAAGRQFRKQRLNGQGIDFIALYHSLYYCEAKNWSAILVNLYRDILRRRGAIHAVLMAPESADPFTTTWLYNHFAGKFCGCRNDQNLAVLGRKLKSNPILASAEIRLRQSRVRFFHPDFAKFMAVVWMILLYPAVHNYSPGQRREITEFIYERFWKKRRPLIQLQDHLAIYRGIKRPVLI